MVLPATLLMAKRRHQPDGPPSYVVVGTSLGGAQALARVFKDLPADFPGAILVVMHVSESGDMTSLMDRLQRTSELPMKSAENGEGDRAGDDLRRAGGLASAGREGPRSPWDGPARAPRRPAIDVLFRSAADAFRIARARAHPHRNAPRRDRRPPGGARRGWHHRGPGAGGSRGGRNAAERHGRPRHRLLRRPAGHRTAARSPRPPRPAPTSGASWRPGWRPRSGSSRGAPRCSQGSMRSRGTIRGPLPSSRRRCPPWRGRSAG